MTPTLSIVIPVRDQAPRLRLTLAALERQDGIDPREIEVIVVDDGSRDGAWEMLAALAPQVPYRLLRTRCHSQGCRGATRNAGAAAARGAFLIFLDADACPGRGLVAAHLAEQQRGDRVAIGDFFMIPRTEHLIDPARGTPFPDASPEEVQGAIVIGIDEIREQGDAALLPHAVGGVYPGFSRWQRAVEEMLDHGGCAFDWVGLTPHNMSMRRETFFRIGGFDPFMRHLEAWDLGIKARRGGCRLAHAARARSFHLYHRRDHALNHGNMVDAERLLLQRHPDAGVEAGILWGSSLALGAEDVPDELSLSDWRVVQRHHSDPGGRQMLATLYRRRLAANRWASLLDYLGGVALNAPPEIRPGGVTRSDTTTLHPSKTRSQRSL